MKRHLAVLLPLGTASWWGAFQLRGFNHPYCAQATELCSPERVAAWERWAISWNDPRADWISFLTQDLSGALALLIPAAWIFRKGLRPAGWPIAESTAILLSASVWNGALKETFNSLTQRPRPFVYANPAVEGLDASHYTSFYSGHTSFAALAWACAYLSLRRLGASPTTLRATAALGAVFVFTTALARVLAGRHFPTDTLGGMAFGVAVAAMASWPSQSRANARSA